MVGDGKADSPVAAPPPAVSLSARERAPSRCCYPARSSRPSLVTSTRSFKLVRSHTSLNDLVVTKLSSRAQGHSRDSTRPAPVVPPEVMRTAQSTHYRNALEAGMWFCRLCPRRRRFNQVSGCCDLTTSIGWIASSGLPRVAGRIVGGRRGSSQRAAIASLQPEI